MAHKIYFSTSDQSHNPGPKGYIEKFGMQAICNRVRELFLQDSRFVFNHSPHTLVDNLSPHVTIANAWGAEIYISLHSNAGQKGTVAYHFSTSARGKRLAQLLFKYVAPLSPGADTGGVQAHDGFLEIHAPTMPSVLLELEAHDWLTGVAWLTTRKKLIARAIYRAVCEYYWLAPLPALIGVPVDNQGKVKALKLAAVELADLWQVPHPVLSTSDTLGSAARQLLRDLADKK